MDNKDKQQVDYCNGCATTWVSLLGLKECTYCHKPVKEIGWVENG